MNFDSTLSLTNASKSQLLDFYDPNLGEAKYLFIRYKYKNKLNEVIIDDLESLSLPSEGVNCLSNIVFQWFNSFFFFSSYHFRKYWIFQKIKPKQVKHYIMFWSLNNCRKNESLLVYFIFHIQELIEVRLRRSTLFTNFSNKFSAKYYLSWSLTNEMRVEDKHHFFVKLFLIELWHAINGLTQNSCKSLFL